MKLTPALLAFLATALSASAQQAISSRVVAQGLIDPVFVTHAPGDDASRIFVVGHTGLIQIVENGVVLPTPFLDIEAITLYNWEEGMHGMVFHPDYQQNGYFYVTYSDLNSAWVLARYERDALNPNLADPNSALVVLTFPHPSEIHHGGWMEFDQDGYLFVSVGDGSDLGDPPNHAQRGDVLLGKILRIDVDHPSGGMNYGIPPDNPFVGDPNYRDEIWTTGLRNPWRCDLDDLTGDLYIGDVGNFLWEEVDVVPAGQGGLNLGWRIMEGAHCNNPPSGCNQAGLTLPVHEYLHNYFFPPFRCSITGGEVYRGRTMATMHGRYFFADYCGGEVWSFRWNGRKVVQFKDHTPELGAKLGPGRQLTGFGTDADGELYICDQNGGKIHQIVPAGLVLEVPHLAAGSTATASVYLGAPNQPTALLVSVNGLGLTPVPPANLTLFLDDPQLVAIETANATGDVTFTGVTPAGLANRTIWLEAAQFGEVSNVVVELVD